MAGVLEAAFWICALALAYGYAGYPLLVALVGALRPRPVDEAGITPRISLLIAAYDEEEAIGQRLENALASDYPAEALEVIVASDGSTDATEEIVARAAEGAGEGRVRLLSLPRRGKAHALNAAARRARGEILVFSDANTQFEPDALRMLVRSFADPGVGGVAGRTRYRRHAGDGAGRGRRGAGGGASGGAGGAGNGGAGEAGSGSPGPEGSPPPESAGRGERLYWRYDTRLKELESRTGSVVSAHGGMYAVRRELFRPLEDASVTDDFAVSTGVVAAGRRLVFESRAVGWERPVRESRREFRRRVRLMTRGLRSVLLRRELLDPFRHGFYAVSLFSRKVLRRLLCLALPVLLVSSVALAGESAVYAAAAGAQLAFYGLAAAGWLLRRSPLGRAKLFYVPFFYCMANLASLVALANLVRGRRIERWSPQRHEGGRKGPVPPAVVIGLDCPTGLQAARILDDRDVPVIGIAADPRHPCARTRACRRVVQADPAMPHLLDVLHELAVGMTGDAVLLPCTDAAVLHLARERDQLPACFRVVLPETGVIETLLDKARFQDLARRNGYPVPETRLVETREDAEEAARSLRFPCALKPPVKTPRWESLTSAKVFKVETPDALMDLHDRLSGSVGALVVQEWIEGPDTAHVTCNCYIDRHGEPRVDLTTRKLRQWPLDGGQACLSEEWRDDLLRDRTLEIFREVGHRGFGYLEFKWDRGRGRHVILEANVGRPTGRSATAEAAGVELLLTAYRDALGLPLPDARRQRFRGVRWIHLRHDLQAALAHALRGDLGPAEWLRSLRGPRAYALFSLRDPLPFVADLGRAAGKLARVPLRATADAWRAFRRPGVSVEASRSHGQPPGVSAEASGHDIRKPASARAVDFRVAGVVGLRLEDASPQDLRAVEDVAGPPRERAAGTPAAEAEPDIVVRYVDRVSAPGIRLVQGGRSGHTDGDFFLLGSPGPGAAARLRLRDSGRACELLCPRGSGLPPLLRPLVDLMALKRGWAPVHASAWVHRGLGVLAAGWDRSGKTGALLAFAERGSSFVGDDRVMVHREGRRMTGVRRPLTVRGWHVSQLPGLAPRVDPVRRSLAAAGPALYRVQRRMPERRSGGALAPRLLGRAVARIRRRLAADLSPEAVFGEEGCPCEGRLDATFLLQTHDDPSIRVDLVDPGTLARRLAATVRAELQPLVDAHLALQFAFPERRWPLLEQAQERAAEILEGALRDRPAFAVRHPYPCALPELYREMASVLGPAASGAAADAGAGGATAEHGGTAATAAGSGASRSGSPDAASPGAASASAASPKAASPGTASSDAASSDAA